MDDLFSNLVLTTLQVADLTGRTPDTVRRWVRLGKVPVERRGHSTGIPAELVAALGLYDGHSVRRILSRLEGRGLLRREGRGCDAKTCRYAALRRPTGAGGKMT